VYKERSKSFASRKSFVSRKIKSIILSCSGTVVLTFQQCFLPRQIRGQHFAFDGCPEGQVIRIISAKVVFRWDSYHEEPRCSHGVVACKKPARRREIMHCNGRHSCHINSSVLIYTQGKRLCTRRQNGNSILIRYQCICGIIMFLKYLSVSVTIF